MKKITLLWLILFGIGLTMSGFAATIEEPVKPTQVVAAACPGDVINAAPCDLKVCVYYIDCNGNSNVACVLMPAGAAMPFNAIIASVGGCCSRILGVQATLVAPPTPPSAVVPPGGVSSYFTGAPGPCMKLLIDFSSGLNCIIRP